MIIKTTIRLPRPVLLKLDSISGKTGVNRTDLIRMSIAEFLEKWEVN